MLFLPNYSVPYIKVGNNTPSYTAILPAPKILQPADTHKLELITFRIKFPTLFRSTLKLCNETKYLGFIFDCRLN